MLSRLLQQHSGYKRLIEAAYDAILMERLRMRQEGKIRCQKASGSQSAFQSPPKESPVPAKSRLHGYNRGYAKLNRHSVAW